MRRVLVVVLAVVGAGCPRGSTGPATPEPSSSPDAALGARPSWDGAVRVPDAPADAAVVAPPDAPPAPTAEEEARFEACARACTMYAVCYELVYGEDYYKGSQCMSECEDMQALDRADFFEVAAAIEPLRGKRRKAACERLIGE